MLKSIIIKVAVTVGVLLSSEAFAPSEKPLETVDTQESVVEVKADEEAIEESKDQMGEKVPINKENPSDLEEVAFDLAGDFMVPLYGWTYDEEGEPYYLKTREDFNQYYSKIANMDLANEFIEAFFTEQNGELEVIPTEPPLWLERDLPYELHRISDSEMEIVQSSSEDLYGPTTLTISYKKTSEGSWIIEDVDYDHEEMGEQAEM